MKQSGACRLSLLLAVAYVLGAAGCVFDPAGLGSQPLDAGQEGDATMDPDAAPWPDASVASDSGPPVDAAGPCATPDPPWWDPAWRRRRPMDLGVVGRGYTVTLNLEGAQRAEVLSHVQGGLEDLRVLRHGSAWSELNRIARDLADTTLMVRFQVPDDLDGTPGEPRYFLYYDNPQAGAPPRDPRRVFLFFDDFSRSDLWSGGLYAQWDDSYIFPGSWWIDNGELVQDGTSDLTALLIPGLAGMLSDGFELSYRWLSTSGSSGDCVDSGPVFHFLLPNGDGFYLERQASNAVLFAEPSHTVLHEQPLPPPDDQWHRHTLRVVGDSVRIFEDSSSTWFTLPYTPTGAETVGVATYCYREMGFRFDSLSVRYLVDPEPLLTAGDELFCPQE